MTKLELFNRGVNRVKLFCEANNIPVPPITMLYKADDWHFNVCAYYRYYSGIHIHLPSCALPAGELRSRNWNWPGSTTDREPYGVLCHELGHHCDWLTGTNKANYSSEYGQQLMYVSGEKPITSYCENGPEWFAEMMRLFITNAYLLKMLRPITFELISMKFKPVSNENWVTELGTNVPERIVFNLVNKVK